MSKKYWREYTAETEAKHAVLKQYLGTFGKVLGRRAGALFYIDGFAGKGRHDTGEEGSPLIAMRVADELARKGLAPMHLAFIEADPANYGSLVKEVTELQNQLSSVRSPILRHGKFEDEIFDVLQQGPRGRGATFLFVDPFGYSDIPMNLIVELAKDRWRELFITFMSRHLNWFMSDETKDETRDRVFDSPEWRNCKSQDDLVRLYARILQTRLHTLGCTTYVFPFEVAVSSSQGLYHLLHVCHDPKGREAMEKAVYSAGKLRAWQSGSQALLTNPQIEKEILEQLRLQPDQGALELAGALWLQETFWLMTWRGDFALALRNLENQGLVEIYRRVDKPKRRKGSQPNADLDRVRLLQH
ncbi:MAG: three-Cys-motif partner protein TcmP [Meiothermus silvanus]|nr:three-Cys-motif partner protein TcmP [Allomeiothermus silvanus]